MCDLETSRMGAPYIYDISHLRVNLITFFYVVNFLFAVIVSFLFKKDIAIRHTQVEILKIN